VSVFRPSARTTDPAGREWEIYAYRLQLPHRAPPDPTPVGFGSPREAAFFSLFDGIAYLLAWIPRLLLRFLVDFPAAGVRALRSDRWTIEAISWAPFRASYTWTTTSEHRGQVLAQVEGGLARGETPRPRNAQLLRSE
jgi:hypothetical protein